MADEAPSDQGDDLARLASLLIPHLKEATTTPAYSPPTSVQVAHQKQIEFNTSILNDLAGLKLPALEPIIERLKDRNSLLALSDTNPNIWKAAEVAKSLGGLGSESNGLAQAVILASTMTQNTRPPPRKRPYEPFSSRGAAAAPAAPQSFGPRPLFPSFPRRQGAGPCFGCGQHGHFKSACPYGSRR